MAQICPKAPKLSTSQVNVPCACAVFMEDMSGTSRMADEISISVNLVVLWGSVFIVFKVSIFCPDYP